MDNYMPMGTTGRHNNLVGTFFSAIVDLLRKKEASAFHEECALTYLGTKKESMGFKLVDINSIDDRKRFIEKTMPLLETVQPDFMLFKDNLYLKNENDTRWAGQPDLIVEVWSESNSHQDRTFKMNLYATSPITEHWYIEQDSNKVECYIGSERLPDQCLTNILKTQKGLEFDLRYLAIES